MSLAHVVVSVSAPLVSLALGIEGSSIMTLVSRYEIVSALQASTLAYSRFGGNPDVVLTDESCHAYTVCRLEELGRALARGRQRLFSMKYEKRCRRAFIHTIQLGERVMLALKADVRTIQRHFPMHDFNPYADLLVDTMLKRNLFYIASQMHVGSESELAVWVDTLNDAVDHFRKQASSTAFFNRMKNFKRSSDKNYRELLKYTEALHMEHSRLLVLRIDLGYAKNYGWPNGLEQTVGYAECRAHREDFFKYLRKTFDGKLAGFVWKLEYGLLKSFHYHVIIFFKGSSLREDVSIARIVGEHWRDVITSGTGLYYNCNAHKERYKCCGIGMVNHDDVSKLEGLRLALVYLTKPDYFIKIVAPGGRTMGKAKMPKPRSVRLGRPRLPAACSGATKIA